MISVLSRSSQLLWIVYSNYFLYYNKCSVKIVNISACDDSPASKLLIEKLDVCQAMSDQGMQRDKYSQKECRSKLTQFFLFAFKVISNRDHTLFMFGSKSKKVLNF